MCVCTAGDGYRHFRAAQGLASDLLDFFGWKASVISLGVAIGTWLKARITRLAGVEQFVLSLGAFAFVLVILNAGAPFIARMLRRRRSTGLEFQEWHSGSDRSFPVIDLGHPSWISVANTLIDIPKKAVPIAEIEGGEDQSFILFVTGKDHRIWVCKAGQIPVAVLDLGHWRANIIVESDNVDGFEGTVSFTILPHRGLAPDNPAFIRRRSVARRLKSA